MWESVQRPTSNFAVFQLENAKCPLDTQGESVLASLARIHRIDILASTVTPDEMKDGPIDAIESLADRVSISRFLSRLDEIMLVEPLPKGSLRDRHGHLLKVRHPLGRPECSLGVEIDLATRYQPNTIATGLVCFGGAIRHSSPAIPIGLWWGAAFSPREMCLSAIEG